MLSRSQFEIAAKAFIANHDSHSHSAWSWFDSARPGYGFMSRTTIHTRPIPAHDLADEETEDDATVTIHPTHEQLTCKQYVVYSASFQVPAFYFTIHNSNGSPLPLSEIVKSSLFKLGVPDGSHATTFALTMPTSSFPLLSQGDHPILGTPCWYLHPCESANAVQELMREVQQDTWDEITRLVRWLEMWFMVLGGAVSV
ncbi:hypothetical protein BDQ12DRAFT_187372 [Crucibulum laeve]|uniref:Ubiquitin-like-conjugating enzyme ATG10 n=1 Tax=Crucibulum laeve TaxID=68775 RepID=A0A5C3MEE9_9AGAR|nr:hypothetical protein BDQ12DRAFT_187372 [Crucibulum laeve]